MFVCSEWVGPLRQLVTLDMTLPFELGHLFGHGMVVHVVPAGAGVVVPGMGIALYGLDGRRRDTWAEFISRVRATTPELPAKSLVATAVEVAVPIALQQYYETIEVVLEVRVDQIAELVAIYERDLAQGSLSLQTQHALAVGAQFVLRIIHPRRRDSLSVPCRVMRRIDDGSLRGIEAEFLDLDDRARALFWEFVDVELAEFDEHSVPLVDESQ